MTVQRRRHFPSDLGEGVGGFALANHIQSGRFGSVNPFLQDGMVVVPVGERERSGRTRAGCGREDNRSDVGLAYFPHAVQRLSEGLGQMRLVEQYQAVVPQEPGVHRLHAVRNAVAAKQQPRTNLVHGRTEDDRLSRRPRPVMLQWHPSTETLRHEWRLIVAGQVLQSGGRLRQRPPSPARRLQPTGQADTSRDPPLGTTRSVRQHDRREAASPEPAGRTVRGTTYSVRRRHRPDGSMHIRSCLRGHRRRPRRAVDRRPGRSEVRTCPDCPVATPDETRRRPTRLSCRRLSVDPAHLAIRRSPIAG